MPASGFMYTKRNKHTRTQPHVYENHTYKHTRAQRKIHRHEHEKGNGNNKQNKNKKSVRNLKIFGKEYEEQDVV